MKLFEQWYAYFSFCMDNPLNDPACRTFWTSVIVASLTIGAFTTIAVGWNIISYKMKHRAALNAQAMPDAIADDETMERHLWVGDDVNAHDDLNSEVRIRAAIARQRSKNVEPTA